MWADGKSLTLVCALVGVKGSAFSVDVDENKLVDHLKDKIAEKQKLDIVASQLQLFLAKKDDAWLESSTDDVNKLKKGKKTAAIEVLTHEDNELQGESGLQKVLTGMPPPSTDQIHVLVVAPEQRVVDSRLLELQESLLHHVLLDAPTSTSARSNHFKANLCTTYQCDMGKGMLRCMLLDTALPSSLVLASHLFRRSNEFLSEKLMGIPDIDDVRNGLLLFKPLEHALDHFQLSFIYDKSSDEFRLKIFDQSLRRQRLFGKLDQKQRAILLQGQSLLKNWKMRGRRLAPGTNFDIQTTFGDVEGRALCFKSVERPYKRCLNLQARLARNKAIEKQWIQPDEDTFEDFWSEGMSLAEKMDFYYASES